MLMTGIIISRGGESADRSESARYHSGVRFSIDFVLPAQPARPAVGPVIRIAGFFWRDNQDLFRSRPSVARFHTEATDANLPNLPFLAALGIGATDDK